VQPLIDLTFRLNGLLLDFLPDALVESINHYEAVAAEVTASLLTFDATWQFPATLITVALLPAICEEFAFRGIIQPLTARWTNNIHAGVWMGAFLFSAIHLQFQGFLPRMIIGAGLGYLVVFSGSLWPAIAAHFFNNAGAIVMAAIYGEAFIQEEMNASRAWELGDYGFAIVALAIGIFGIRWIRRHSQWPEKHPMC
jgi:membrane protease YdiL (CAAX protease family)